MDYTIDDLVDLIARHDEHEDYYRGKLAALIREREAEAWDEGHAAGEQNAADGIAALLTGLEAPEPKVNPYRDEKGDHGNDS